MDGFAGLLLGGGLDLNPRLYSQEKHPDADEPNDARDAMELRLLEEALTRGLPVLAICRGMQLFNVARGGSLVQHIAATDLHRVYPDDRGAPAHEVAIAEDSKLARALGTTRAFVNSRHHQAVDRVGDGLVVTARSDDGMIEALELPGSPYALAVQWHPEDQAPRDSVQRRLFQSFKSAL
jgi:putative glutamine amidotransferase